MLSFKDIAPEKTVVIFELDEVLIPRKDYDLQVYYLFANFIEYLETFPPAQELLAFMTKRYEVFGNEGMFEEAAQAFGIDLKFKENFELLFTNAKLPLKLLLYKEALDLLQELVVNRKQIFLLTAGNPAQQLNKITQTEWNGLEKYLKVYFADEFEEKPSNIAIEHIISENQLLKEQILIVGSQEIDREMAMKSGLNYISIK